MTFVIFLLCFCIFLQCSDGKGGCAIQLHSLGNEDRGFLKNGFFGSISVGNVNLDLRGFAHVPLVKHSIRGIFLVTLWRPEKYCEVMQSASYDTWAYASAAKSLDAHLRSLRPGSVVAGICSDECVHNLTPAKSALHSWGIDLKGIGSNDVSIWYRSSVAFVAWKGRPWKTRVVQIPRKYGPSKLNLVIRD